MTIDDYKHTVLCRNDKASVPMTCSTAQTKKLRAAVGNSKKQQHGRSNQLALVRAIRQKDTHASPALTIITL